MKFQKNPCNESRDTTEKVICTSREVPLVIDQSQSDLHVGSACVECVN